MFLNGSILGPHSTFALLAFSGKTWGDPELLQSWVPLAAASEHPACASWGDLTSLRVAETQRQLVHELHAGLQANRLPYCKDPKVGQYTQDMV